MRPLDLEIPDRIEDVRELGPQLVVGILQRREFDEVERRIRITASRALGQERFWSSYEEDVQVSIEGSWRTLWARAHLQPVSGETAEACLQHALAVVAEAFGNVET
jgi:hypothetical protein